MFPNRDLELELCAQHGIVVGMDEVGRGALAGPVCVGAVAVSQNMPEPPKGIKDSKLLSPTIRESLIEPIKNWVLAWGVGWTEPTVIDQVGLTEALRLAGIEALHQTNRLLGGTGKAGAIILDGKHNWLDPINDPTIKVVTQVKADMQCLAVAAASVLAKVARDRYMVRLDDPGYSWAKNKGYGSVAHRKALVALGASEYHRKSWKLSSKTEDKGGR